MKQRQACSGCRDDLPLGFDFEMAFQPIVDAASERIWGHEALVRGRNGESAASVLASVTDTNRYRFDQACRVKAIESAGRLFDDEDLRLSINFMPNAVYEPSACIRTSLEAARRVGFPTERIMFEFTEDERVRDAGHIERIIAEYRRLGFITAIDDFGAGYAGLKLLAEYQPNLIKIDMALLRGVDASPAKQAIVAGITGIARALDISVIAEGVETESELAVLRATGIRLFQGYLFARPSFQALSPVPMLNTGSIGIAGVA
ncbi:MAG: EAL domain-containing protein [Pseudorhodoplanes sp.]|uniref:EAL domain-containing protein n=1 Tax=Pseudorhodoplanes sp. TaxID=1934341 RepID=UPI003D0F6FAD